MEQSQKLVSELVEDFKANEHAYLSPSYQESQVRQDFIDKFFSALGWDVTHNIQKNPYQQEVKIENKVTVGSSQRRADYAFSIAPNFEQVKFFVEAKKPSRSLANTDDYFQTIRYAWNTKTPISVLTDFEEFHILDCRHKPKIDDALNRKIESFHYSDYTKEEIFAKIYHLFARDAVLSGSLDQFISQLQKRIGKTPSNYQPVDDAFLEELDEYRVTLAKAFKKTNERLQGEELTEAVQRTIDRLVFIRFLEDKGIEDRQIVKLAHQKSPWQAFVALCKRLDPKYNGFVFKQHRILDSGEFNPPDEKPFAQICRELSDPASPYDFNQIPISILGSIYERFLGKVVHATDKRVKVEEKPEVRKAGGVYYTPDYIVQYIVKETVGKVIQGKTPQEISQMAFADIACGSGSFLIQVYQELLDYHFTFYNEHPEQIKEGDVILKGEVNYLSLKKKKEILVNNIYGVDIDYQATEVTQMSLYLKLLEDVTLQETHQLGLFKELILPTLSNNIICGNSIIGSEINGLFNQEEGDSLRSLNFEDVFPRIMKKGGFNAIVGNPPYVRQEALTDVKEYLKYHFEAFHSIADIYVYFIEKGIKLLREDGFFSVIVANKWMRGNYGEPLRKWLKTQAIHEIIDFGDLPVFKGVVTYPCIIRVQKSKPIESTLVTKLNSLDNLDLAEVTSKQSYTVKNTQLVDSGWSLSDEKTSNLINKISAVGIPLSEHVNGKIFYGIKTGFNDAFVIDTATKEKMIESDPSCATIIKPFLGGRDIKRFGIPSTDQYLIFARRGIDIKKYPSVEKHLLAFKERLMPRPKTYKGKDWQGRKPGSYKWYELQDTIDYFEEFDKPKMILPDISLRGNVAMDYNNSYCVNTCYIIGSDDKFLLAILNSKLITYYYSKLSSTYRGGYLRFIFQYLEKIPIKQIDINIPQEVLLSNKISGLVDKILDVNKKRTHSVMDTELSRLQMQFNILDHQIDEAVYTLYGLTSEEISIVEAG